MARADPRDSDSLTRDIRLIENPDGQWTARDLRAEVTAQGESRDTALDNLEAVVEAVENGGGAPSTCEWIDRNR
ncbi:type II toxin-antitoxin system HicB family antitoxin [Halorubrum lipolyticum]|uniref:HicB family protein n=1 Tax=Halorubrum lipolyticum DSM 21995 TaxID=1227482 RepID=M0P151_9EURY|nr:hypothetical protein [Halorubrum lipolyticum]EMA63887.1 hypothetical protein C469_02009 [Halorubrum lipolyticum DSM 21995]